MSESSLAFKRVNLTLYFLGMAVVLLAMSAVVYYSFRYAQPRPPGTARAQERMKNLAQLRAAEHKVLTQYAWVNKAKGIVRVPIDRAMQITLKEWRDPATARKQLVAREEKLTAKPPPAANPYE